MQITEKEAASCILTRKGDRIVKEDPAPNQSVDFSIFGAKEIRDILKNKAHCLRAGFPPDHIIIETFNEIRDQYILRVGLSTYLSQMLGELGTVEVQYCTLCTEEDHPIEIHLNGHHTQPVQRYIAKQYQRGNLPFKVEVRRDTSPGRVEIRYL